MAILAEEGLARLNCVKPLTVTTPCGTFDGLSSPPSHTICGVDIVRSGGILLEAVRKIAPDSKTAKILIQRDEETALPKLFYSKLPPDIANLNVVLCDPMVRADCLPLPVSPAPPASDHTDHTRMLPSTHS